MATKQFTMATLAGGITAMIVGFVFYGLLLADFYNANTGSATGVYKEVPIWGALILGQVLYAALLTMIIGWRGDSSAGAGLKTGALIGLVMGLSFSFTFYATSNISNLTATLVDPIIVMIQAGITGAVIGAVLGMGSPTAGSASAGTPPEADADTGGHSGGM